MVAQPVAFLDRDGVLNQLVFRDGGWYSPMKLVDFRVSSEASSAVTSLHAKGYLCVVVTNQPEIERGRLCVSELSAMHDQLIAEVGVDAVFVCPHDSRSLCSCRKPKLGLIAELRRKVDLDFDVSFMVGDRTSDLEFARNLGVAPILLRSQQTESSVEDLDFEFWEIPALSNIPQLLTQLSSSPRLRRRKSNKDT